MGQDVGKLQLGVSFGNWNEDQGGINGKSSHSSYYHRCPSTVRWNFVESFPQKKPAICVREPLKRPNPKKGTAFIEI